MELRVRAEGRDMSNPDKERHSVLMDLGHWNGMYDWAGTGGEKVDLRDTPHAVPAFYPFEVVVEIATNVA